MLAAPENQFKFFQRRDGMPSIPAYDESLEVLNLHIDLVEHVSRSSPMRDKLVLEIEDGAFIYSELSLLLLKFLDINFRRSTQWFQSTTISGTQQLTSPC
jgi:hypothetical protein